MNRFVFTFSLVLLLPLFLLPGCYETKHTPLESAGFEVSGRIKDAQSRALAGVTVMLTSTTGAAQSCTTDASGEFVLTGLATGEYNISPAGDEYRFYAPSTHSLFLKSDTTAFFTGYIFPLIEVHNLTARDTVVLLRSSSCDINQGSSMLDFILPEPVLPGAVSPMFKAILGCRKVTVWTTYDLPLGNQVQISVVGNFSFIPDDTVEVEIDSLLNIRIDGIRFNTEYFPPIREIL